MRDRSDSEHGQAVLRAAIVGLLLVNTAWASARDSGGGGRLWAINLFAFAFSLLLLAQTVRRPQSSPGRRALGAAHDNVAATLFLFVSGPLGAVALFVYPFVTVGNGFRFGVRYLAFSGLLGACGIATLVAAAPGWDAYRVVGSGVLLSHVVVTIYTGVMLRSLHQTQTRLHELASSDALTGLPNRRHFMELLAQAAAADRSPACLYLDLDGFKEVNDRFGHDVGDAVLSEVARATQGCLRASDTLARLGGDEFAAIVDVPAGRDDARLVAERIAGAVEAISAVDGHEIDISVSIGISLLAGRALDRRAQAEALLRAADGAMYAAKQSGKGTHRFAEPQPVTRAA